MILRIRKTTGEAIGLDKFVPLGIGKDEWKWLGKHQGADLSLARLSVAKLDRLAELFKAHPTAYGVKVILRDIATWRGAIVDSSTSKPRTLRHFSSLLTQYLLKVPGHRIYSHPPTDDGTGAVELWLAHYVNKVEYHPERRDGRDNYTPACVEMELRWIQFDKRGGKDIHFRDGDVSGTVVEMLAAAGFYAETPALRAEYLKTVERFGEVAPKVGRQYLAVGKAKDAPDGNPESDRYWKNAHVFDLTRMDVPSRVILDVFHEDPEERHNYADKDVRSWFWKNIEVPPEVTKDNEPDDPDEDVSEDEQALSEDVAERPVIEIPIHPWVVVFDLLKHLRLRLHVLQLTDYHYDTKLADKLVMSPDRKRLVELLIESKAGGFTDVVQGKSGGTVVLLAGPPGTGKTLTAEVYAESEERPLYSVQCSQLGTNPENLEEELLKVFERARRWNAVLLLDEADVYVHERGNDLTQNAIVGVFLRVLEYQPNVLFLTTNRPDDVDDAIASRCVARLNYAIPTAEEQFKIWAILLTANKVTMRATDVKAVVKANPTLSGRDVKQLIKLAQVMARTNTEQKNLITVEMIDYVKQFRPVGDMNKVRL